ncbi:MFS transporter [Acidisoma sp. 7E03]
MKREGIWQDLWRSGLLGRFLLLCLGVWLHAADTLVSATIMPQVVADIGGLPYISWSLALYECGSILAGTVAAAVSLRMGIRAMLLAGAWLFALGCLLGMLAPSMALLLIGRLAQGLGGGMLLSLSYLAIERLFPQPLWTRLIGITSAIWGVGALLGPLIGGVLADAGDWRLAFAAFAVQAAGLGLAGLVFLPRDRPDGGRLASIRLPWLPLLLLMGATGCIAEAGVSTRRLLSLGLGAAGLLLLYAAARADRAAPASLLPRALLAARSPLGAGLLMIFALSAGTTGFAIYGPFLMTQRMGVDSLTAGYVLAVESIAWSLTSVSIAAQPATAAPRLIRLGACMIVGGVLGFAISVPAGSLAGIIASGLLQGGGFGLCWPAIIDRIIGLAPRAERALAAGAPSTVQRISYAAGATATGLVAQAAGLTAHPSEGAAARVGFWIFAAFIPLLICGLVCAWRFSASPRAHDRAVEDVNGSRHRPVEARKPS